MKRLTLIAVSTTTLLLLISGCNSKDWIMGPSPADALEKRVYSLAPDELGSVGIYPAGAEGFDRWTFFLARKPMGVFVVPIKTQADDGTTSVLGYGAEPVPSGTGEDCPDASAPIPAGLRWVKVWNFRASLPGKHDYLFVVTPSSVMAAEMMNPGNSLSDVYTPYRFNTGDCVSGNPADPSTPEDCALYKRVIYGLSLHQVGTPNDPEKHPIFPVCALQPVRR